MACRMRWLTVESWSLTNSRSRPAASCERARSGAGVTASAWSAWWCRSAAYQPSRRGSASGGDRHRAGLGRARGHRRLHRRRRGQDVQAVGDREHIVAGRELDVRDAARIELREEHLAAEELHHRLLALFDGDPGVERGAGVPVGHGKTQAARGLQVGEIAGQGGAGRDGGGPRGLGIALGGGVGRVVAGRQRHAVAAGGVPDRPGVGLAGFLDDHDRRRDRAPVAACDPSRQLAGRQASPGDLLGDHGGQVAARAHLQPALEGPALAGRQAVGPVHVLRAVAHVLEIGGVQGDEPVFVVGHHPVGERARGRPVVDAGQTRNGEQMAAARPQGQAGAQAGQRRAAAVGHGDRDPHLVLAGPQRVDGRNGDLAPVALGEDHDLLRAFLDHLDAMIGAGPGGPVVGDEIGEHHTVAADLAVHDRRHVHQRPARHAIGRRGFDG